MSEPEIDLARELPRYRAPAELRSAILRAANPERERARRWWWPALLGAAATAMAMTLLWTARVLPGDPLQRAVRAVVAQHNRQLIWSEGPPRVVPAELDVLTEETGIGLARAFLGDQQLRFVAGEPIYLEGHRGVAIHYADPDEHLVSYMVLPAPALSFPERHRVQVGHYRPALTRSDGFAILMWKQDDLAAFLVSDMVSDTDLDRFKTYFLRIRETTEPFIE